MLKQVLILRMWYFERHIPLTLFIQERNKYIIIYVYRLLQKCWNFVLLCWRYFNRSCCPSKKFAMPEVLQFFSWATLVWVLLHHWTLCYLALFQYINKISYAMGFNENVWPKLSHDRLWFPILGSWNCTFLNHITLFNSCLFPYTFCPQLF